jgi:glycosyltransferase involved in cell wall biosynthesis
VLVVTNGCSDDTSAQVRELCAVHENLTVLDIEEPIGKGGALRAGLTTAGREPYVAFLDADGSASPTELEKLLTVCLQSGIDGAIGSRWLPQSRIKRRQSLSRRIASRGFNAVVRTLFGMPYSDTQCGAKVFRRSAIDAVAERLEIANFAADVDLLFLLRRAGFQIIEVPIVWSDVPAGSQVKLLRAAPAMLLAVLRLRLRHSALRNAPFLDRLASAQVIPVVRSLRVLALRTESAHPQFDELVREFEAQGHSVRHELLVTPFALVRFAFRYSTKVYHRYDLILDGTGPVLARFLSRSDKPILTARTLATMSSVELLAVVRDAGPQRGYRVVLARRDDGWFLATEKPLVALRQRGSVTPQ